MKCTPAVFPHKVHRNVFYRQNPLIKCNTHTRQSDPSKNAMFSPKSKGNRNTSKASSSIQSSASNGTTSTPHTSSQTHKNAINNNHNANGEPSPNNANQRPPSSDTNSTIPTSSISTKASSKGLSYFSANHFTKMFKNPSQFVHTTFGGHRNGGGESGRRPSPPPPPPPSTAVANGQVASPPDIAVSNSSASSRLPTSRAIDNIQQTTKNANGLPNGQMKKVNQPSSPVILFETVKLNIKSPEKNIIRTGSTMAVDNAKGTMVVHKKPSELIKPINQLGQPKQSTSTTCITQDATVVQRFDSRNQRNVCQILPSDVDSASPSVYGSTKLIPATTNGGVSPLKINVDFTQPKAAKATTSGLNNNLPKPSSQMGIVDTTSRLPPTSHRTSHQPPPPPTKPAKPTDGHYFGRNVAKQIPPGDTFTPNTRNDVLPPGNCDTDDAHKDYGYFNSFFLSNGTTADYQPPPAASASSIDANHNGHTKDVARTKGEHYADEEDGELNERVEKRQDSNSTKQIVIHTIGCSDLPDIKEEESESPSEPNNQSGNPFRTYLTKSNLKTTDGKVFNTIYHQEQTSKHNNNNNNQILSTRQSVHLNANHDPLEWIRQNCNFQDDNEVNNGDDDDDDDSDDDEVDLNAKLKIAPEVMAALQLFLRQHGNEYIKQFLQVIIMECVYAKVSRQHRGRLRRELSKLCSKFKT